MDACGCRRRGRPRTLSMAIDLLQCMRASTPHPHYTRSGKRHANSEHYARITELCALACPARRAQLACNENQRI